MQIQDLTQRNFAVIEKRPKRFYLKEQSGLFDSELIESSDNTDEKAIKLPSKKYLEKDLHPFLAQFAYYHLRCTKTINHSKSNKKEYGEWVHPDIIGCNFPIGDWSPEVLNLSSVVENNSIKIISFETKTRFELRKAKRKLLPNGFQVILGE